jgi:riboflavin biosynthesis pyrimidine reductase
VVLVAAETVRAEGYGPSRVPVAVVTRSCRLDWEAPFFTAPLARPLVVTVAAAPPEALARAAELAAAGLLDELCLTLSPRLVGGAAKRILDGPLLPGTLPPRLCSVCEQDGFLFLRYRPEPGR